MSWDKNTIDSRNRTIKLLESLGFKVEKTYQKTVTGLGLNDEYNGIEGYDLCSYIVTQAKQTHYFYDKFIRNSDCDIDDYVYMQGPFDAEIKNWEYYEEKNNG